MESDPGINPPPEPAKPDGSTSAAATADPGLPPVAPPSGKFIIQMFLVPGLIVGVVVVVLVVAYWLLGNPMDPKKILKGLRDSNPEVRWRTASDLAQNLPRNLQLQTNVDFGLSLVELLESALEENRTDERHHREKAKKSEDQEADHVPKALREDRDTILFLASALGHFLVPMGTDVLGAIAVTDTGMDVEDDYRRRIYGVQALCHQGRHLKDYEDLQDEEKRNIQAALLEEAQGDGARAARAAQILDFLKQLQSGRPARGLGAGEALVRCAAAKEPHIREYAALGLTFWDADGAESTLEKLLRDDGNGPNPASKPDDVEAFRRAHPDEVRRIAAKYVSYNAMQALLRRGSERVKSHFDLVEEMIDVDRQLKIWDTDEPTIKESRDYVANKIVHTTLEALRQHLKRRPDADLAPLKAALKRTSESDNEAVSSAAKDVLLLLN